MKRLFIAAKVCFDKPFLELIGTLRKECSYDDIVWVNNDLQHLTLRFLGATPESKILSLIEMLYEVTSVTKSFKMEINKLGVFGSRYAPKVVWLGFEEFEYYQNLFKIVEENLVLMGFEPNRGNFVPHITIGRIKKLDSTKRFWKTIEKAGPYSSQIINIDEISLIQSHLTTQGPIYKTLQSFRLQRE